jgi:hypothetical protein
LLQFRSPMFFSLRTDNSIMNMWIDDQHDAKPVPGKGTASHSHACYNAPPVY